MSSSFVRMSTMVLVGGLWVVLAAATAKAQPNSAGWQAAQAHATAQRTINHAMQQHWHSQQVMQTARDHQNFSSRHGGGGGQTLLHPPAAAPAWQPGDQFRSDDLALEYERLSRVDYRSLSPIERGQYKAACRKFRLAVNHGYVYR
jgi:hypothetical protein